MKTRLLLQVLLLLLLTIQLVETCNAGQFNSEGICFSCMDHCLYCSEPTNCYRCKNGYLWDIDKGACKGTGRLSTFGIVVLSIVGGTVLLSFLTFLCVFQAYRKHHRMMRTQQLAIQQPTPQIPPEQNVKFNIQVIVFEPARDQCSICLESETEVITPCLHYFHFQCLKEWNKHKPSCPNCKAYFVDLKSCCVGCKSFTKDFVLCPSNCPHKQHQHCVSSHLAVNCENCIVIQSKVNTGHKIPQSEVRIVRQQAQMESSGRIL